MPEMPEMPVPPEKPDGPTDPYEYLPLRTVELYVLLALAEGDKHGWAIIEATLERTEDRVRLDPGTLYRALQRLREAELLDEAATDSDPRRRPYRLTRLGREVVTAEVERLARVVDDARNADLLAEGKWA